ncbi:MAG: carbon storage regulator CsrA [Treponema sp.]|jgi:carbon storage regulator|nr:carbon storage regulator CsrA [Treponema sp.]
MLILTRKLNEKIKIGDNITVTIIEIRGDQIKIGIEAPKDVKVFRQEVFQAIRQQNKIAAVIATDNLDALRNLTGTIKNKQA